MLDTARGAWTRAQPDQTSTSRLGGDGLYWPPVEVFHS